MDKRYLLTITNFDPEKSQITIVDQKHIKVIHQSISERKLIGVLTHTFTVIYGDEINVVDNTLATPEKN